MLNPRPLFGLFNFEVYHTIIFIFFWLILNFLVVHKSCNCFIFLRKWKSCNLYCLSYLFIIKVYYLLVRIDRKSWNINLSLKLNYCNIIQACYIFIANILQILLMDINPLDGQFYRFTTIELI